MARQRIALLGSLLVLSLTCPAEDIAVRTEFGFNLKQAVAAPYGSAPARRSLAELAALGVQEVALVVFLWQSGVDDDHIVLGDDTSLPALAHAIRDAKAAGLKVIIKPHVWVPGHWAGEVRPRNEDAITRWFADYERVLRDIAGVAQAEGASRFVIATELRSLAGRGEWVGIAQRIGKQFRGELVWVADGLESAERFAYWRSFPAITLSLYPAPAAGENSWGPALERARTRLATLSRRWHKPVRIAEIGLRSAEAALLTPWESPEQRAAPVDLQVQARAYRDVLAVFAGKVASVDFWCWYTDPAMGGADDSDFTPRGKPAAQVLRQWLAAPVKKAAGMKPAAESTLVSKVRSQPSR